MNEIDITIHSSFKSYFVHHLFFLFIAILITPIAILVVVSIPIYFYQGEILRGIGLIGILLFIIFIAWLGNPVLFYAIKRPRIVLKDDHISMDDYKPFKVIFKNSSFNDIEKIVVMMKNSQLESFLPGNFRDIQNRVHEIGYQNISSFHIHYLKKGGEKDQIIIDGDFLGDIQRIDPLLKGIK